MLGVPNSISHKRFFVADTFSILTSHFVWHVEFSVRRKTWNIIQQYFFTNISTSVNRKYEDNVAAYHIFFSKVISNILTSATIPILLIYEVSFYLITRYFCYPILKSTCFITTFHSNLENITSRGRKNNNRNIRSLYHPQSFVLFIIQF